MSSLFFFSSRRRHTRSTRDWSSDVCSSDLGTRFPSNSLAEAGPINEDANLLRAADLIGQLGDPNYIRKANALYYEFEEAGLNRQRGYTSPAVLVSLYP